MNYGRVRQQAALKKKIKEALFEKADVLRSLSGSERQRAEDLIIKKVKEEFKVGYKNAKNREKKPELEVGTSAKQSGQESDSTQEGSDQSGSDEQGSSEDGQEQGSPEGDAQSSDEDSEGSDEAQDGSDDQSEFDSEKSLEEMNEEELRKYAEEKGIDLGNSVSVNGMLKKIKG